MRRIGWVLAVLFLAGSGWYLFIRPYDFLVRFQVKALPGVINQSVKTWSASLENSKILGNEEANQLEQIVQSNDSIHRYLWKFSETVDSTSTVTVYVKDVNHSFQNKLEIPFSRTDFEIGVEKNLRDFLNTLNNHLEDFKVTVIGEDEIKSTFCAYIPIKSSQLKKATGMMKNYPILDRFVARNQIQTNGRPFLEVTHWDKKKDSLSYNFCYPIIKTDSLPKSKSIKYKEFKAKKALKAIYNGNYITSDRAWYALLNHAKKLHIEVDELPIEVFHTNPNYGGDELHWKAEIYMPISERLQN